MKLLALLGLLLVAIILLYNSEKCDGLAIDINIGEGSGEALIELRDGLPITELLATTLTNDKLETITVTEEGSGSSDNADDDAAAAAAATENDGKNIEAANGVVTAEEANVDQDADVDANVSTTTTVIPEESDAEAAAITTTTTKTTVADNEEQTETETETTTTTTTTTTEQPAETKIITTTSSLPTTETTQLPICNVTAVSGSGSGNLTSPTNCSAYFSCANATAANPLATELSCPDETVYTPRLGRCSLDLNECAALGAPCSITGKIASNADPTSYYRCVPNLLNGGYHKFRVRCSPNAHYSELLDSCWPNSLLDFDGSDEQEEEDNDAIKAELKLIKKEAKAQRKAVEKEKKLLKKQLKEQLKAAKKQAKLEQAKNKKKTTPAATPSLLPSSSLASSEET